jgi:exo-beta-1,3-glucanase (GH17 family)/cellulose synthase/poly-beta-1,6-N-acetylglucosamine synthase-like glycosyltransferase
MARANLISGIMVAILTFSFWAYLSRPEKEPAWPERIQGFCFSPMRAGQSPITQQYPTTEQIRSDLVLLAGKTHAVRTYSVESTLGSVPDLAREFKINVALGAWIGADRARNEREVEGLIQITGSSLNVVRAIVGNEVLLRGDIPVELLISYLDRVRKAVQVPVSTAEPWHVWVKHPELAEHVDFLAVHMLPYWEGIHLDQSIDYIVQHINGLKALFPGKPIVIAEVGWPSNGRTRFNAVASDANEAVFLRRFLYRARQEKYVYYVMEAFDQPWKRVSEGSVGAYWGVYDVQRKPKFPFTAPIVPFPNWYVLAGISIAVAAVILALLFIDSKMLRSRGRNFLAFMAYLAATSAVWIVYDYIHQYLTVTTVLVGITMFVSMFGVILILMTEAHEWAETLWVTGRRRSFKPVLLADDALPLVSIHVPAYDEPAQMMIETLDSLSALDYPRYEVLVIDNNTQDPAVWQPVAEHCTKLGPRFHFFHVDQLAGFKAGALNYALARTSPLAEIVAVIDSDYMVDPQWLRDLVPQFHEERIALVQAPQDYRDADVNVFKSVCYSEYRGFFHIGMITRNERNAIIQHGTMTMVRRQVLDAIGGWGEWCITEDAELGLRIFEHGYEAIYIHKSYGRGLMPDTLGDYQKQRFRWAYGAVQIMRRHAGQLLAGRPSRLHKGQRYHFIAGWLPWIADGINLIFNFAALAWSLAMIINPRHFDPPLIELSLLPLALFIFKVGKIIYLYRRHVGATIWQTFAAALSGLALSHTIAKAILLGFVTKNKPFFRTPKLTDQSDLIQALGAVYQETAMLMALILAAVGVYLHRISMGLDLKMWMVVLGVQAVPYLAAVMLAFIRGFSGNGRQAGIGAHPLSNDNL